MKNVLKTSLIAAASGLFYAGVVFAATSSAPTTTVASAPQTVDALKAPATAAADGVQVAELMMIENDKLVTWDGDTVIIVNINNIGNDTIRLWFKDFSDEKIAAVQAAVAKNKKLSKMLTDSNVQMNNIVGFQQSGPQNVEVFVR